MGEEKTIAEIRAFGNGLIILYVLFMIGAMFAGMELGWAILGILIMAVLTYAITPAYPEMIAFYNYVFFALLVLASIAALFNLWTSFIPELMVILGPLLVVGIPVIHILYLIVEGRRRKAKKRKLAKPAPPSTVKEAEKGVLGRIGKKFALVCGYETLTAKRAFGYLISRTVLSWIIGSIILALLAYFGIFS